MKLWMSSEWSGTDEFGQKMRVARNEVESSINQVISHKEYDLSLDKIRLILVLMEDEADQERFCEIKKYNKRSKIADFNLQLDYVDFTNASIVQKQKMIVLTILRAFEFLEQKGLNKTALDELRQDILSVAQENGWIDE